MSQRSCMNSCTHSEILKNSPHNSSAYTINSNQKRIYSFKTTPPNSAKNLDKVKESLSHAYQTHIPDFARLTHEFERMKEAPKRLMIALLAILFVLAAALYTYWDHLKSFFGQQGAEVASMTLKSEGLQRSSVEMVNSVITDPNTTNKVVELLKDLVARDDTKALLVGLLVRIIHDETTKANLGILISEQIKLLLQDPKTLEQLAEFAGLLLRREDTKDNLKFLVMNVLQDEAFKGDVQNWAQQFVLSDTVKNSAIQLGLKTVDDVLRDENVRKAGVSYLVNVVTDKKVQSYAGHALRTAALMSINPWASFSSEEDADINSPPQEKKEVENAQQEYSLEDKAQLEVSGGESG